MASHNKLMSDSGPGALGHSLAWELMVVLVWGFGFLLVMMFFFAGVVV